MKKTIARLCALLCCIGLIAGCATTQPIGVIYTEVSLPMDATSNVMSPKVGKASCQSILSLVATGDASIEAAMKNGGIKKIHHVDWDAKNILGIIGTYTVTVYGE